MQGKKVVDISPYKGRPPTRGEKLPQTYGETFVIVEHEPTKPNSQRSLSGMLVRGYVRIELLNLPPEKAAFVSTGTIAQNIQPRNSDEIVLIEGGELSHPRENQLTCHPVPKSLPPIMLKQAIVLKVSSAYLHQNQQRFGGRIFR